MNILRPLSPHLPIYKPQLTSTFPISHRISGAFLATIGGFASPMRISTNSSFIHQSSSQSPSRLLP
ncbi:hypothetical protein G4B88_002373 (mitochondrion) [Cannabis sativa]|uniref:Succinate dehydrogenase subunit 3 n=1 Tax=Cannabis sativa TaxID=3483 RepID=A0A7J6DV30_CANSA|nr:hypothetical protein G4B88_002373 [Cannabis sativa]